MDSIQNMLVHVFSGPGRLCGFTADEADAALPSTFGPWTFLKLMDVTRDVAAVGIDSNLCLEDIQRHGFHIADVL